MPETQRKKLGAVLTLLLAFGVVACMVWWHVHASRMNPGAGSARAAPRDDHDTVRFEVPDIEELGKTQTDKKLIADRREFFETLLEKLRFFQTGSYLQRVARQAANETLIPKADEPVENGPKLRMCAGRWTFQLPAVEVRNAIHRESKSELTHGLWRLSIELEDSRIMSVGVYASDTDRVMILTRAGEYRSCLERYQDDYDIYRKIWTTDFTRINLRQLAHDDLAETLILMRHKAESYMSPWEGGICQFVAPNLKGFLNWHKPLEESGFHNAKSLEERLHMTYVGVQAFAANQRVTIIVCTRADCTDVQAAYEGNWRLVKQVLTSWSEHNLDDPAKEMLKQARELVEKGYVEHRRRAIILLKIAEHYESDSSKEIAALLSKLERE